MVGSSKPHDVFFRNLRMVRVVLRRQIPTLFPSLTAPGP